MPDSFQRADLDRLVRGQDAGHQTHLQVHIFHQESPFPPHSRLFPVENLWKMLKTIKLRYYAEKHITYREIVPGFSDFSVENVENFL